MRCPTSQILLSAGIFLGLSLVASGANAQTVFANNNRGLSALSTTTYSSVVRLGFAIGGDSDLPAFFASNSACSLNSGKGDGGSQVPSYNGDCWLAQIPVSGADIRDWGLTSKPIHFYVSKSGSDRKNHCVISTLPCLTIQHAGDETSLFDVAGGNADIDFQPGDSNTWTENVAVNRPLRGAANGNSEPNACKGLSCAVSNTGQLILNGDLGNGSNATLACGRPRCGTLIVSDYATVGIENLTMTGASNSCQSTIFDQMAATVYIYSGNTFGPATRDLMHSENPGSSIQIWAPYTIAGSADDVFATSDGGQILVSYGVGTIRGNLTFSQFIFSRTGEIQFNINPAFSVPRGSSVKGRPFILYANAVIQTGPLATPGYIPGSKLGILGSGSRYHDPLLKCVGESSGCPDTTTPVGLGTGGSVTLTPGADERSGEFILTAGTGAANHGRFNLSFGVLLESKGGKPAPCTISLIEGGPPDPGQLQPPRGQQSVPE